MKEIIEEFNELSSEEKITVLNQLNKVDTKKYENAPSFESSLQKILPFQNPTQKSSKDLKLGTTSLQNGRIASVILAGGDGSRLGFDKPKGCYPISPIKKKSLFQLQFEKIKYLQSQCAEPLQVAIITSSYNYRETEKFLEFHDFFGLDKINITLLQQKSLPLLSEEKKYFFSSKNTLALGACGNGNAIETLIESGYVDTLESKNIDHLMITSIDNCLADPFDPYLIGRHIQNNNDITFYCFERTCSKEKLGLLALVDNQLCILDYTNLNKDLYEKTKQNRLIFPFANTNIFCLSLNFIKTLPLLKLHWVKKDVSKFNYKTSQIFKITAWKREQFITDILNFTNHVEAVACDRDWIFAPLKTSKGVNDVNFVHKAIYKKNQLIYKKLTGKNSCRNLELSMRYHVFFPNNTLALNCQEDELYYE